jgi:hypothetical protein
MEDGHEQEYTYRDAAGNPFMVAKWDPALEDWVTRHSHDDIHVPDQNKWEIAVIDRLAWESTEAVKQLSTELSKLNGVMYAERDQLKDDALKCYGDHHRPTLGGCPDVFSDAKVIGSHESNLHMKPDDRMYLCHLCPYVHGYVIPEVRWRKGMYK